MCAGTTVPYLPAEGEDLSATAVELIASSSEAGGVEAVEEVVASLAATLNLEASAADTNQAQAMQTRDVLVDALTASGGAESMTAEEVQEASQLMADVTAVPEQLSSESTEKPLQFVASFDSTALDQGAVEGVAAVVSNLMHASTIQFEAQSAEEQAAAEERAGQRSSQLADAVDTLTAAMASSSVVGEGEKSLLTDSFGMHVKADTPKALEGRNLAGGAVRVPVGALGEGSDAVVAKVVTWTDAGPLYTVRDKSPVGQAGFKLQSAVTFTLHLSTYASEAANMQTSSCQP